VQLDPYTTPELLDPVVELLDADDEVEVLVVDEVVVVVEPPVPAWLPPAPAWLPPAPAPPELLLEHARREPRQTKKNRKRSRPRLSDRVRRARTLACMRLLNA
jgi:hypothetical protein